MTSLPPLYPLIFRPVYKDYIWGGDRIVRRYHRPAPPGIYAESWEISDRLEDMSIVTNGMLAGKSLHDLVETYGDDLVGTQCRQSRFPLLVKLIDARDRLSVQVHPDDESAKVVEGEPKTEMWYVLEADPDAVVFAGLKPGMNAEQLRKALQEGTVGDFLASVTVSQGDVIYIPGGRIHTIGAGCLLLEVQQNSDTTFRVFDWNRVGYGGKPRELHIEQAMKVIRWDDPKPVKIPSVSMPMREPRPRTTVFERWVSPYFQMEQVTLSGALSCSTDGLSFHILFIEDGFVRVKGNHAMIEVDAGTTVLIPAGVKAYEVLGQKTPCRLVRIRLPDVVPVTMAGKPAGWES